MTSKRPKSASSYGDSKENWHERLHTTTLDQSYCTHTLPTFSNNVDNLSFCEVNKLHQSPSSKDYPSFNLTHEVETLRMTITNNSKSDDDDRLHGGQNNHKVFKKMYRKRNITTKHNLSYTGPVFQPSYLLTQLSDDAAYYNSETIYQTHLRKFLERNLMHVVFVLFDMNMQVIGTYDSQSDPMPKGIYIGPDNISSKFAKEEELNQFHANILELKINEFASNVFAVVPIVFGDQEFGDEPSNKRLQYNIFLQFSAEYRRTPHFDPASSIDFHTSTTLGPDVMSVLNDSLKIFEFDIYGEEQCISPPQRIIVAKCDGINFETEAVTEKRVVPIQPILRLSSKGRIDAPVKKRRQSILVRALKSDGSDEEKDDEDIQTLPALNISIKRMNTTSSNTNEKELKWMERAWSLDEPISSSHTNNMAEVNHHVKSTNCKLWGHLREMQFMQLFKDIGNTYNKGSISPNGGLLPFVLFRASEESLGWHYKEINRGLTVQSPPEYLQNVVEILVEENIAPYLVMHVQHCQNCEQHRSTTRHIPGSFDRIFNDLSSQLSYYLPPHIIRANNLPSFERLTSLPHPPIGCFEVTVRPYRSTTSMLLHSKLKSKWFPLASDLVRQLSSLMLPEDIIFPSASRPILEIIAFDSLYKKAIAGAEVTVYRINVNTSKKNSKQVHNPVEQVFSLQNKIKNLFKSHLKSPSKSPMKSKYTSTLPESDVRNSSPEKINSSAKRSSMSIQHSKLLSSGGLEDAILRHSEAYFRVRTWQKEDVVKWLEAYGVGPKVIQYAIIEGLVDGPALLRLVNQASLQRWGLKSRGTINHVLDGIRSLKLNNRLLEAYDGEPISEHSNDLPQSLNQLISPTWASVNAGDIKNVHFNSPSKVKNLTSTVSSNNAEDAKADSTISTAQEQYVHVEAVATGKTSRTGIFRCYGKIKYSGSYLFTITSPMTDKFTSHVFNFNSPYRMGYAASMKPSLVRVALVIACPRPGTNNQMDSIKQIIRFGHESSTYFTFITNVETGHRILVNTKKCDISYESNFHKVMPQSKVQPQSPKRISFNSKPNQVPPEQITRRNSLKRRNSKIDIENTPEKPKVNEPGIQSQSSPRLSRVMSQSTNDVNHCFIGEVYLPCGTYVCDIDGKQFTVNPPTQENFSAFKVSSMDTGSPLSSNIFQPTASPTVKMPSVLIASFLPLQEEDKKAAILREDSRLSSQVLAYLHSNSRLKQTSANQSMKSQVEHDFNTKQTDVKVDGVISFLAYQEKTVVKSRQKRVMWAVTVIENWYYLWLSTAFKNSKSRTKNKLHPITNQNHSNKSKSESPMNFVVRSGVDSFLQKLRNRRAIRIQAWFRCCYWRKKYLLLQKLAISIQTLWSKYQAKQNFRVKMAIVVDERRKKAIQEKERRRLAEEAEKLRLEQEAREEAEKIVKEEEERLRRLASKADMSKVWNNFFTYLDKPATPTNSSLETISLNLSKYPNGNSSKPASPLVALTSRIKLIEIPDSSRSKSGLQTKSDSKLSSSSGSILSSPKALGGIQGPKQVNPVLNEDIDDYGVITRTTPKVVAQRLANMPQLQLDAKSSTVDVLLSESTPISLSSQNTFLLKDSQSIKLASADTEVTEPTEMIGKLPSIQKTADSESKQSTLRASIGDGIDTTHPQASELVSQEAKSENQSDPDSKVPESNSFRRSARDLLNLSKQKSAEGELAESTSVDVNVANNADIPSSAMTSTDEKKEIKGLEERIRTMDMSETAFTVHSAPANNKRSKTKSKRGIPVADSPPETVLNPIVSPNGEAIQTIIKEKSFSSSNVNKHRQNSHRRIADLNDSSSSDDEEIKPISRESWMKSTSSSQLLNSEPHNEKEYKTARLSSSGSLLKKGKVYSLADSDDSDGDGDVDITSREMKIHHRVDAPDSKHRRRTRHRNKHD